MIKEKLTKLFDYPVGGMTYASYMDFLNKYGKITPRSTIEMLVVLMEEIDSLQLNISEMTEVPYTQINKKK